MKLRSDPARACKTCGATLLRKKLRTPDRFGYYRKESATNFDKRSYCDLYCRQRAPSLSKIDWHDSTQVREYNRLLAIERRKADPEKFRGYKKKWRSRHPGYSKKYYATEKGKAAIAAANQRYRARRAANGGKRLRKKLKPGPKPKVSSLPEGTD